MIETIYVEKQIENESKTIQILKKFPQAKKILCDRYQQIFNRKNQCYFLQREKRALILAKKNHSLIQPLPFSPGIGRKDNYYFSLIYNCPFFCSYCFLQGFYRSSHFLVFINGEDFQKEVEKVLTNHPNSCFFCSHDGDILATDFFLNFVEEFFPFFEKHPKALFEIRTKSTNITRLFERKPAENIIIAYSLNPEEVVKKVEKQAPSLAERLLSMKTLAQKGWKIGLRFDPLIYHEGFQKNYKELFEKIFSSIEEKSIHSATLGILRFPNEVYKQIIKKKTNDLIFAPLEEKDQIWSYDEKKEKALFSFCENEVKNYLKEDKIFLYHRGC
jgi:spore photoproduct lyase